MRKPDFDNMRRILDRGKPDRPTLFEFFLNIPLYKKLAKPGSESTMVSWRAPSEFYISAFMNAGYDYATVSASPFAFPSGEHHSEKTRSMNEGVLITDRTSFEAYDWPDPDKFDYTQLEKATELLPDGMKLITCGPGGVLENVMALVGYEGLCFMTVDDPALTEDVFAAVGSRLVRYYELSSGYDSVGAVISNDDWGFKTQTMLALDDMRKYVFSWHKKIVETIHKAGRPAILHSCGQLEEVMDDVIDDMGYDGKHSYEDSILPVEDAYDRWGKRIAVLGGIDLDFVCRSTPDRITERSRNMVERSEPHGSYALGSGNSIPEYVPDENYFAMTRAALENGTDTLS